MLARTKPTWSFGQRRSCPWRARNPTSALSPKTDLSRQSRHVRNVPIPSQGPCSINLLARKDRQWWECSFGKSCAPKRLHFPRSGGTLMSDENTWTGPVVDAHAHFWDPIANDHPWLRPDVIIPICYGDYSATSDAIRPTTIARTPPATPSARRFMSRPNGIRIRRSTRRAMHPD